MRILELLNVRRDELRVTSLLFLFSGALGVGRVFVLTAQFPIFLNAWDRTDLPFVYILTAVFTAVASAGYLRLGRAINPRALILSNLAAIAVITLLMRVALTLPSRVPALALAVWAFVLLILSSFAFWGTATRTVDIRQGKRLFPVVATGEVVGYALGGFAGGRLASTDGAASLLMWGAAGFIAAGVLCATIMRDHHHGFAGDPAPAPAARARASWSSPYLKWMVAYFAFSGAAFVFVDGAFNYAVKARYPVEAAFAAFMGTYHAVTAIVNFVFRGFAAGRMIGRFGILAGLLGLPLAIFVGGSFVVASGTLIGAGAVFWLMTATRMGDKVFRGVQSTSFATLYQPLMERGPAVQTTLEGMVDAAAVGVAGIVLLILGKVAGVSSVGLAAVLAILGALWLVVAVLLKREYVRTLASVLHRRRIGAAALDVAGADVLHIIHQELQAPTPENVIYALDLLERFEPGAVRLVLPKLLEHPNVDVRLETLRRIERRGGTSALAAVRAQLGDPAAPAALRGQAMRVLCVLSEDAIIPGIEALRDARPEVRHGAAVGLLRSGSVDGIVRAGAVLLQDLDSSEPADRLRAATVLRDAALEGFYRPVLGLMSDDDPDVRRRALEAAGAIRRPELFNAVVKALGEPGLAGPASQALVRIGPPVIPVLVKAFERHAWDRTYRLRVLRVLGLIQDPAAGDALWPLVTLDDPDERSAVLAALAHAAYTPSVERLESAASHLDREVRDAANRYAMILDLGQEPSVAHVCQALQHELEHARHRVFTLLGFRYPDRELATAWANYSSGDGAKRAYALELLENFIDVGSRDQLFPILEERTDAERSDWLKERGVAIGMSTRDRVGHILTAPPGTFTRWTTECAQAAAPAYDLPTVDGYRQAEDLVHLTLRLKQVDLFGSMPEHVIAGFVPRLHRLELGTGDVVFAKGDVGDSLYVVAEGRVRVHDDGRTLAALAANDVFGEFTVLQSARRTASVTASERTTLIRLDQRDLYELIGERVEVARSMIEIILERLEANRDARARHPSRESRVSISLKPLD